MSYARVIELGRESFRILHNSQRSISPEDEIWLRASPAEQRLRDWLFRPGSPWIDDFAIYPGRPAVDRNGNPRFALAIRDLSLLPVSLVERFYLQDVVGELLAEEKSDALALFIPHWCERICTTGIERSVGGFMSLLFRWNFSWENRLQADLFAFVSSLADGKGNYPVWESWGERKIDRPATDTGNQYLHGNPRMMLKDGVVISRRGKHYRVRVDFSALDMVSVPWERAVVCGERAVFWEETLEACTRLTQTRPRPAARFLEVQGTGWSQQELFVPDLPGYETEVLFSWSDMPEADQNINLTGLFSAQDNTPCMFLFDRSQT